MVTTSTSSVRASSVISGLCDAWRLPRCRRSSRVLARRVGPRVVQYFNAHGDGAKHTSTAAVITTMVGAVTARDGGETSANRSATPEVLKYSQPTEAKARRSH